MAGTGRAIWTGSINFSLVSIPVKLYPIVSDADKLSFHQHRISDGSRIAQKRVAVADGEEVPFQDIVSGIELAPGNVVLLTPDDLAGIRLPTLKEITLETVVNASDVSPLMFSGKNYYVAPAVQGGVRAYALLRDTLETSGRAGVVKVALRSRESMALLVARDGVLVLELLNWAADIRTPQFPLLDSAPVLTEAERNMAGDLVGAMEGKFDPSQYTDEYEAALNELVEAKTNGTDLPKAEAPAAPTTSLADALAASLKAKSGNSKAASAGAKAKKTAKK